MGGYGSGRWRYQQTKQTVDSALGLPTTYLREALQRVADGEDYSYIGTLGWNVKGHLEQITATIGYTILLRQDQAGEAEGREPIVHLRYTSTSPGGHKSEQDYPVRVVYTTPPFGGRRWWWLCPLLYQGQPCGRRVAKLYLPGGDVYFGCRHCHSLTYESCNESHKYDAMFARLVLEADIPGMSGRDVQRLLRERWGV